MTEITFTKNKKLEKRFNAQGQTLVIIIAQHLGNIL